jgi:ABC-type glycerol-3-phosphate transport system substrate-binding protein
MRGRRVLLLIAGLAATAMLAAPAHAAGTCTVTPDPVSLSADVTYTVHAEGLTPNAYYDIRVDQNNQKYGHHADASGVGTDTAGSFDAELVVLAYPRDQLVLGTATVHVQPSNQAEPAGKGGCRVSFEVIP